jgi:hypothetical protein
MALLEHFTDARFGGFARLDNGRLRFELHVWAG